MKSSLLFALSALLTLGPVRAAETPVSTDTIIECAGVFETISTDKEITSTFRDKVLVTGNNLKLTCDFLTVIAIRKDDGAAALGKYGYFKSLVATGNVRIVQGDREATCGRAEIFPGEDKIVLSENPLVRDTGNESSFTAPVLELYRGQRRAIAPAQPGGRTRIVLPALKDLGYEKDKATPSPDPAPKTAPAK
ncbi:MAG: LptA/OstA family protein [Opitutaceae bacterium]